MQKYQNLKDFDLKGRSVFLRLDFNVPLNTSGKITDDTRILAALPTIEHVLEQTNRVCLASHLGRPKGRRKEEFSLKPVAIRLAELLGREVLLVDDVDKEPIDQVLKQVGHNQILLLENLRFYEGESSNDAFFSENLLKGIDFYINDAFGTIHREHASIVGVPKRLPSDRRGLGFLVEKELKVLSELQRGEAPFTVILGGAKVSDKVGVVLNLLNYCNHLIIGGAMAYSFLKYKGVSVGHSFVEDDKMDLVKFIFKNAEKRNVTITLPVDHVCSESFTEDSDAKVVNIENIPDSYQGMDIGPKTIKLFSNMIEKSKTIFWNGPMGVFEWQAYSKGTMAIAEKVAAGDSFSVVGGGDSVAAVKKLGVEKEFSHISTGGGASLKYLEGSILPGLKVLEV
ncbi:MAG: phosphoglycerate kinase [Zetaproteobacteria bacterium]|nr:phosphoglycerate kinase [Pseudobdellovibrionaceae bacterium]